MSETDNIFKAYSVQEIAAMLGIGKTKTRELLDSGILPVTKVGRQYFTSPASIQEFLKNNIGGCREIDSSNFTQATKICLNFFRYKGKEPPYDIEATIQRFLLPIRPNRKRQRVSVSTCVVSFNYRLA